jgi:C-terminal processing protease CtpA/Prc
MAALFAACVLSQATLRAADDSDDQNRDQRNAESRSNDSDDETATSSGSQSDEDESDSSERDQNRSDRKSADSNDDRSDFSPDNGADYRRSRRDRRNRDQQSQETRGQKYGLSFSETKRGLEISDVDRRSKAHKFGLREGDIVLDVNGQRVGSPSQFRHLIQSAQQDQLPLTIRRDDRRYTIWWQPAETLARDDSRRARRSTDDSDDDDSNQSSDRNEAFLGVVLDPRYDAAVVRRLYPNSPAQAAGVRVGDTILSVNGNSVQSADDVSEMITEMKPGDEIEIQVVHAPPRTLDVRLSTRGQQQHRAGYRGEIEDRQLSDSDQTADYDDDARTGQRRYIRRGVDGATEVIDRGFDRARRVINRD